MRKKKESKKGLEFGANLCRGFADGLKEAALNRARKSATEPTQSSMDDLLPEAGEAVDYSALVRLADANWRSYKDMLRALIALRMANGLTQDDVDARMGWRLGAARVFESNPTSIDMFDLREYASAVGARLTFTVEADPDVDATA